MRGGVFVCHASKDAAVAQRVVAALEAGGVPCWIAPRDIEAGQNYAMAILEGLDAAPAVVLVFSKATNQSQHVPRELEMATSSGTPIVPVRLENVDPAPSLRYFIGTSHWLDTVGSTPQSWGPPLVQAVRRTVEQARGPSTPPAQSAPAKPTFAPPAPGPSPAPSKSARGKFVVLAAVVLGVVAAVAVVALVLRDGDDSADRALDPSASSPGTGTNLGSSEAAAGVDVTCWDGSAAAAQVECPVPEGKAGMTSVFPSLTDDCTSETPSVEGKVEVYECLGDGYLFRFTRWTEGFDRYRYYDAANGVTGAQWSVEDELAGRQWLSYEVDPEEEMPYQWSGTYERFPFSVSVESTTEEGRSNAIVDVQVVPPSQVGLL